MKHIKKIVTAALFMSLALGVHNASADASFKDVSSTHWAKSVITQAVKDGYVNGHSDNTFKPADPVTRAEFASIVARAFDLTESEDTIEFSDVQSDFWAQSSIEKATRMGVLKPTADSKFSPKTAMTRTEMATWITNALVASHKGYESALSELKKTITPVVEYYKVGFSEEENARIALMVGTEIMSGDQNGKFNPNEKVTRAEMVSILYRYLDVAKKDASTFRGLNEMREVGTTGTNMVTLANARTGNLEGKPLPFKNVMNTNLAAENGSGTVKIHHYILIDSYNKTPKSIYAKMFKNLVSDGTGKGNDYAVFADITYTANKSLSTAKTAHDAILNVTGVGYESETLTKYGVTMAPRAFRTPVSDYYKAGVARRGWMNPLIDSGTAIKIYNGKTMVSSVILEK